MKVFYLAAAIVLLACSSCGEHRSRSVSPGEQEPGGGAEQKGGLNNSGGVQIPGRGNVGASGTQTPPRKGE